MPAPFDPAGLPDVEAEFPIGITGAVTAVMRATRGHRIRLVWYRSNPFAVYAHLRGPGSHPEDVWAWDREQMATGLVAHAGAGDVRFHPYPSWIVVSLTGNPGPAGNTQMILTLPRDQVEKFLRLVNVWSADMDPQVVWPGLDADLARLFEETA